MIGAKPLILGKLKENKGVVISSLFCNYSIFRHDNFIG